MIDGGGQVVLDGGGTTRVLDFESPNYRATMTTVTLQHLTIAHGKATGTAIAQAPPPCSQGTGIDGGGAGRSSCGTGFSHVVDVTFDDNHAAALGPDVGGGAIYATGSLGVVVVGSRFTGNSGSNGGAIGSLNSDLTVVDAIFAGNQATGEGEIHNRLCLRGERRRERQWGQFGSDRDRWRGPDGKVTICGSTFTNNSAGALVPVRSGGRPTTRCRLWGRSTARPSTATQSVDGGGALYIHNCDLRHHGARRSRTTRRPAQGRSRPTAPRSTSSMTRFPAIPALKGLGGALSPFSNGGTIQSCTFASNT